MICSNQGGTGCCDLCTSLPCSMSFSLSVTYIGDIIISLLLFFIMFTTILLLDSISKFYLDNHPSLTHYYNFESSNVQGTSLRNLATNSFDSSLVNGATITAADGSYKVGNGALKLVSNGDYNTSPYFSITNGITVGNTELTFALWFKTSIATWTRLFDFGNNEGSTNIWVSSSRSSTGMLSYNGMGTDSWIESDIAVSDNTWRHLVFTIGTDGTYKIYMNGQLARTDTNKGVPSYIFRANAWIGKSRLPADAPYNGQIDEFRIYNTSLNPNDVLALYLYTSKPCNVTFVSIPTTVTYLGIIIIIIIITITIITSTYSTITILVITLLSC